MQARSNISQRFTQTAHSVIVCVTMKAHPVQGVCSAGGSKGGGACAIARAYVLCTVPQRTAAALRTGTAEQIRFWNASALSFATAECGGDAITASLCPGVHSR